jgi:peptidoglycan/LPS O-acetylase OafA/YrhL
MVPYEELISLMTEHGRTMLIPEVMSHGKRAPLNALTSIRFFAAMYVVLYHCEIPSLVSIPAPAAHFFDSGYTGVTLFFSLSGFILAYNYPRVASRRDFWISRFARIYPVYIISILAYLLIVEANPQQRGQPAFIPAALLSALLIQSWFIPYATQLNSVAWTLSAETFFYAVFPFANPYCRKPTRVLLVLFLAFTFALAISPILIALREPADGLYLAHLLDGPFPLFRLGTFLVGVLAGGWFLRGRRYRGLLPSSLLFTSILLVWAPPYLARPLKDMLLSYAYTGVIYGLATVNRGPLANRWLLLGGEISYSVYLLQFIVTRLERGTVIRLFPSHSPDSLGFVFGVFIPSLLLVSYLSFRFVEVPARLAIRNRGQRSPAA